MSRVLPDGVVDALPLRPRELHAIGWVSGSFVSFVLAALVVADMLAEGWSGWGLARVLVRGTLNLLGLPPAVAYYVPTGLFFGVMAVLLLDSYKRKQGVLLWLGVLGALLFVFVPRGILVGLVENFTWVGFALGATSFVAGLRLGGVSTDVLESEPPREFPRVPMVLLGFVAVVSGVGLLETLVVYDPPITTTAGGFGAADGAVRGVAADGLFVLRLGAAVVAVAALREFTGYERQFNVMMIGPQRSGKTAAFGGFHAVLDGTDGRQLLEHTGTIDARDRVKSGYFPRSTTATDRGLVGLEFVDERPFRLPEKVRFQSVDYAGEKLGDVLAEFVDTGAEYDLPSLPSEASGRSVTPEPPVEDAPTFDESTEPVATDGDGNGAGGEEPSAGAGDASGDDPWDGWMDDGGAADRAPDESGGDATTDSAGFMFDESDGDDGPDRADRAAAGYERASSWEEATDQIDRVSNHDLHRPIQDCLRHADRVVLTLPLDDMAGPIIERGNAPRYYDAWADDDDDLAGQLWRWGYRRRVDLKPVYQGRRRHRVVDGPLRLAPWRYLHWYRQLVETLDDTDFVVVCTMSDWAVRDFKSRNADQQGAAPNPVLEYETFREHVYHEVLADWLGVVVEDVQEACDDAVPHLLWFSIENDDTPRDGDELLRIETDVHGALLNGANEVLARVTR